MNLGKKENARLYQSEEMERAFEEKVRLANEAFNERKRKREALEQLANKALEEKMHSMTDEEKLSLVPESDFAKLGSPGYRAMLLEKLRESENKAEGGSL